MTTRDRKLIQIQSRFPQNSRPGNKARPDRGKWYGSLSNNITQLPRANVLSRNLSVPAMTASKAFTSHSNWDFSTARTNDLTHGLHPYPAKMVPHIARELIRRYSNPGSLVYDPFCGSGTTLVEASLARRRGLGIDLNPLAILLTRVKTTPLNPDSLRLEWGSFRRALRRSTTRSRVRRAFEPPARLLNLKYWYRPYVMRDLGFVRALIEDYYPATDDPIRNFLRVVLARTAREVSNQRRKEFKRWRIPEPHLRRFRPKPLQAFVDHVEAAIPKMGEYYAATSGRAACTALRTDARTYRTPQRAGLIVTSPPYGDSGTTVAYGQFSSFAMEWLGLYDIKPRHLDVEPLGPAIDRDDCLDLSNRFARIYRRIKRLDGQRAHFVLQFFQGMTDALIRMRESLESSGHCCMVVGNRTVRGIGVPTDAILCELAESVGFELEEIISRRVRNKVMPYATKPLNSLQTGSVQSTLRRESVIVFQAL